MIDGKYGVLPNGYLINVETDEYIPDDEPVFLLRARDLTAMSLLEHYRHGCAQVGSPQSHIDAIDDIREAFGRFRREQPHRLKVPGVRT